MEDALAALGKVTSLIPRSAKWPRERVQKRWASPLESRGGRNGIEGFLMSLRFSSSLLFAYAAESDKNHRNHRSKQSRAQGP